MLVRGSCRSRISLDILPPPGSVNRKGSWYKLLQAQGGGRFLRRAYPCQVFYKCTKEARRKAGVEPGRRTWQKFEASFVSPGAAAAVMMAPESAAAGCQAEAIEPMDVETSPTAPLEAAATQLEPILGHMSSGEPACCGRPTSRRFYPQNSSIPNDGTKWSMTH